MSDVFISYAKEDREHAKTLASSLEAHAWSVWWDRKIVPGQSFDQMIEKELENARSVVVLWSKDSIASEWVKNEAASAAERGLLIPALIGNVIIPLEFRSRQAADLTGFNGDLSHGGFQALCDGIAALSGSMDPPSPSPVPKYGPSNVLWGIGASALTLIVVGLFVADKAFLAAQGEKIILTVFAASVAVLLPLFYSNDTGPKIPNWEGAKKSLLTALFIFAIGLIMLPLWKQWSDGNSFLTQYKDVCAQSKAPGVTLKDRADAKRKLIDIRKGIENLWFHPGLALPPDCS
ncbi:MAG: toll/interleukin-1 receptor domain-containing protein [Nitrosomonas ureae]